MTLEVYFMFIDSPSCHKLLALLSSWVVWRFVSSDSRTSYVSNWPTFIYHDINKDLVSNISLILELFSPLAFDEASTGAKTLTGDRDLSPDDWSWELNEDLNLARLGMELLSLVVDQA